MPLPTQPLPDLPPRKSEEAPQAPQPKIELPSLPQVDLSSVSVRPRPKRKPKASERGGEEPKSAQQTPRRTLPSREERARVSEPQAGSKPGWAVDPRTGKEYRLLPASDPEAVKAFVKGGKKGLSLEEMMKYTADVEGFDIDDLNSTAEAFLGHLRVPPDRDEIERLRREKAAAIRRQNAVYSANNKDELEETDE